MIDDKITVKVSVRAIIMQPNKANNHATEQKRDQNFTKQNRHPTEPFKNGKLPNNKQRLMITRKARRGGWLDAPGTLT